MTFEPTEFARDASPIIENISGLPWNPMFRNACTFGPDIFLEKMFNFIRNPNLNSTWLFRADILIEQDGDCKHEAPGHELKIMQFKHFHLEKGLIRRLIPRNSQRDKALDQTCLICRSDQSEDLSSENERTLIVYLPHVTSESELPFYHPKVRGLAHLHEWDDSTQQGSISIHYYFFDEQEQTTKLVRTALNLLSMLHKHGQGAKAGYVKQVHHDTLVPQVALQTTYSELKGKYARKLMESWAEVTDPAKHVFEDLSIAAFLMELWKELYRNEPFPGFVDIGCGNGLLVYILTKEGYSGWGFDARKRKSWQNYNDSQVAGSSESAILRQHVLLPSIITDSATVENPAGEGSEGVTLHDGRFAKGTFIISNHADELTPWTPILATMSECPFIMIPCCSHDLSGAKFRAPPPKQQNQSASQYSSLVAWVLDIATDCGWVTEKEVLRIPSTRNIGLIGRNRGKDYGSIDLDEVVSKYGGTGGYLDNVMKLVKTAPKGH